MAHVHSHLHIYINLLYFNLNGLYAMIFKDKIYSATNNFTKNNGKNKI
jgi:hypothetical protein